MAKKSAINNNKRREKLARQYAGRRARLKAIANDETKSMEERFEARHRPMNLWQGSKRSRTSRPGISRGKSA